MSGGRLQRPPGAKPPTWPAPTPRRGPCGLGRKRRRLRCSAASANQSTQEQALAQGRTPFEQIALLLQGGGALGSYQAGVYEALGRSRPASGLGRRHFHRRDQRGDHCRQSAGAAASMRLREFWEPSSASPLGIPYLRNRQFKDDMQHQLDQSGRAPGAFCCLEHRISSCRACRRPTFGRRGPPTKRAITIIRPLRTTLERLVDFDRINAGEMRFSVGAVNVRSGNFVYFDSTTHRIGARACHGERLAAARISRHRDRRQALLGRRPDLQHAAALGARLRPRRDTLAFQVDLWNARGELPRDMVAGRCRQKEIIYSSRNRAATERYQIPQKLGSAQCPRPHREIAARNCATSDEVELLAAEAKRQGLQHRAPHLSHRSL